MSASKFSSGKQTPSNFTKQWAAGYEKEQAKEREKERERLKSFNGSRCNIEGGKIIIFHVFLSFIFRFKLCQPWFVFKRHESVCMKERRLANKSAVISCLAARLVQLSRNIHREKVHREIYCKREWTVVI